MNYYNLVLYVYIPVLLLLVHSCTRVYISVLCVRPCTLGTFLSLCVFNKGYNRKPFPNTGEEFDLSNLSPCTYGSASENKEG